MKPERKEAASQISQVLQEISTRYTQIRSQAMVVDSTLKITQAALEFLECIRRSPELSMTEITEQLHQTKGRISQMASALKQKGLIMCVPGGDQREKRLALTERGRAVCEQKLSMKQSMSQTVEEICQEYSEEQLNLIGQFLDQIEQSMSVFGKCPVSKGMTEV
ncbi:MarR family winged helix-turn-helix transcriptional regulator [Faecalibaculum rodentium]|uniref:MarR family winged helix-turn-helix transcriptional regulator n=1 Tax=Faecalibaculum rodentium TaxID=1702221 RepID=UPI0023F4076D|nr:MarR family transcriptional regulator [Faecalibaculum rodentium]